MTKSNLVDLFPNSTIANGKELMVIGDIITDKMVAVRREIDLWPALTTPSAHQALLSMEPGETYTVTATKLKSAGEQDASRSVSVVKDLMNVEPDMAKVVYTGLSGVFHNGARVLLFVGQKSLARYWVPAEYEPLIAAFDARGFTAHANAKRVVVARSGHDVGDFAIILVPHAEPRGSKFIVSPVEPKLVEPADGPVEEPEIAEPVEVPALHPFGPGLDGPAPWEARSEEPDSPVAVAGGKPTPSAGATAGRPVFVPTAPGLDLIIPTRVPASVGAQAAPVIPEPAMPVLRADGIDPSQAMVQKAASSPLAAWSIEHSVVGTDPSSTMIGGEVGRVIDELRRAATAEGVPGLGRTVAGALAKRVTAADYWVAVRLEGDASGKPAPDSAVALLMIDGCQALAVSRPLAGLVDGDLFQVLPPWARQVFIAESVLEMVDQIKAAATRLGVSPLGVVR
jgi:hypothetical protein